MLTQVIHSFYPLAAFLPQDLPLPFSLQAPGVGRQEGYLELFSPEDRPQDL